MKSKSCIVILVGTDGSGKTSIAKELESSLSIPVNYIYFGLKEYWLPGLDIWVKRFGDNGIIFRALVLPLEYLVRRLMFPRTGFVLLDRVPGWVFVGRFRFLYWFYQWILPKADFLVHCTGDPKLIFARKPERSLGATVKDVDKWRRVADQYPARQKINIDTTANSLIVCVEELRAALK